MISRSTSDIRNADGNQFLDDLIGQFFINIADKGFAAKCDCLIGDGDPLFDVCRDHLNDAKGKGFFSRCGSSFGVYISGISGTLKSNLSGRSNVTLNFLSIGNKPFSDCIKIPAAGALK